MKLHASGENYLKTIFILQKEKRYVKSVDVAESMNVSKASVSHAVKLLRKGGFLTMDEDYTLHLTDLGQETAEKIYERYQYFAAHLVNAGVDSDVAEKEACRIEHAISDYAFKKIREEEKKSCPFQDSCTLNTNNNKVIELQTESGDKDNDKD